MILISISLCPVINVDGFISTSIQDFRTKYNILTLQAMIASPELSHRKKVTGFIHPHSKALYPLSESYNNIKLAGLSTYMRYCYPTGDDNIFSSATCNAPKFIAAQLSCVTLPLYQCNSITLPLTLPLILMDMIDTLIAVNQNFKKSEKLQ